MKTTTLLLPGLLIGALYSSGRVEAAAGDVEEFDEFVVRIEINATDGDAGLQGMLDGPGWKRAWIKNPHGRTVFRLDPHDNLREQGVTEVCWESAEPKFDEDYDLEDFLERFPEGTYTAYGRVVGGLRLFAEAELTHDLPAAPVITSHQDGDEVEVDGCGLTVTWDEVTDDLRGGPLGSDIVRYTVTVETEFLVGDEEVTEVFEVDVPADRFQADVPADFFVPGRTYKIELGAHEESGNSTFSEVEIDVL